MRHRDIGKWQVKIHWIVGNGGMVLLNTNTDYMHFGIGRSRHDEYFVDLYKQLSNYVVSNYGGQFWHALPEQVARFWRKYVASLY